MPTLAQDSQVVSDERVFPKNIGGARLVAELVNWVRKTFGLVLSPFPGEDAPFRGGSPLSRKDGCIRESH